MKFRNSLDDVVQVPVTKTLPLKRCWIGVAISVTLAKTWYESSYIYFTYWTARKKKSLCCLFLSKAWRSFETSAIIQPTTQLNIAEDLNLPNTKPLKSPCNLRRSVGITVEPTHSAGTYDKILLGSEHGHSKLSYTDKEREREREQTGTGVKWEALHLFIIG